MERGQGISEVLPVEWAWKYRAYPFCLALQKQLSFSLVFSWDNNSWICLFTVSQLEKVWAKLCRVRGTHWMDSFQTKIKIFQSSIFKLNEETILALERAAVRILWLPKSWNYLYPPYLWLQMPVTHCTCLNNSVNDLVFEHLVYSRYQHRGGIGIVWGYNARDAMRRPRVMQHCAWLLHCSDEER